MELLIKTNEELRQYIPSVVLEVDDEVTLYGKMEPWITQSCTWLSQNLVSDSSILSDAELDLAKILVVNRAFYYAVPSLDLVLTPNGFGVVNSTNIAPASKERMERLRATLIEEVDSLSIRLLNMLRYNQQWIDCSDAAIFRSTFLYPSDLTCFRKEGESHLEAFLRLLPFAKAAESELIAHYLGPTLTERFARATFDKSMWPSSEAALGDRLRQDMSTYVSYAQRKKNFKCPNSHDVWHIFMSSIRAVTAYPEFKEIWEAEVGNLFEVKQSDVLPSKQGGCWL